MGFNSAFKGLITKLLESKWDDEKDFEPNGARLYPSLSYFQFLNACNSNWLVSLPNL
jgi:hypothetical protein